MIKGPSVLKIVNLFHKGLLLLLPVSFLFPFFFFLPLSRLSSATLNKDKGKDFPCKHPSLRSYDRIGKGALEEEKRSLSFLLPSLQEKISEFRRNSRPDASISDLLIHFQIEGIDKMQEVLPGQKVYLSFISKGNGTETPIAVSDHPTPLWIRPHLNEKGELSVEERLSFVSESGEKVIEEKRVFLAKEEKEEKEKLQRGSLSFLKGMEVLKKGKWWGPDQLVEVYGGESYQSFRNMERIEIFYGNKEEIIPVKEGEVLSWKEEGWIKEKLGMNTKKYPLAHLTRLTAEKMEWEIWDESGLIKEKCVLSKERNRSPHMKLENIFTKIRQRTAFRISCLIGQKTTLIRKGDWLFFDGAEWKLIKNGTEFENILKLRKKGSLFIFEGIEKNREKGVFFGRLFDPLRIQVQEVRIPLSEQKNLSSSHKKKNFSSKIRSASEERASQNAKEEEPLSYEEGENSVECERKKQKAAVSSEEIDDILEQGHALIDD
ncbi:MAG: hypothetical protein HYZ47_00750 [Simkania negevensis]|nr:hypothetical protein [Simkania negevensis]